MTFTDTDKELVTQEFTSEEIDVIKKHRDKFQLNALNQNLNDANPAVRNAIFHVIVFCSVVIPFSSVEEYVRETVSRGLQYQLNNEESYSGKHIYGLCSGNCFMCQRLFHRLPKGNQFSRIVLRMPRLNRWIRYHDRALKWSHEIFMDIIDEHNDEPEIPEVPSPSPSPPPRRKRRASVPVEDSEPFYMPISPGPQEPTCYDGATTPEYNVLSPWKQPTLDAEEEVIFHSGECLPDEVFAPVSRKRRYSSDADSSC